MPYKDKQKNLEARRRYYYKNKDKENIKKKIRKDSIYKWFLEYKSTLKCERCGENHPACIDFHHKGKKERRKEISYLAHAYSKATIEKEIKKCIILCSNCHRKLHYDERNNKK